MKGRCLAAATHVRKLIRLFATLFSRTLSRQRLLHAALSHGAIPASAERRRSLRFLSGLQVNNEMAQRLNQLLFKPVQGSCRLPFRKRLFPKVRCPILGRFVAAIRCQPETSAND
jgi:hypothetical protein